MPFLIVKKSGVMATIKLSDDFINEAKATAIAMHRSVPKQIEHWARLGKIAEENPDLPIGFVKDVLISLQEVEAGDVTEYEFG
ncbi:conserved hypothetical protein [Crenothrix polyspora]|uniref:ParD-like antitoxin of type II toxin-antitoxin system n=1 Tax=Crenothrix polyspora TaxID=360316 RepID=A0A1R4H0Q6_9GAMM|nr:hypothetical protein [Crenothrix polyspora]SJM89640.1 conserved hypothetical protein [Crenothrix polyspora]